MQFYAEFTGMSPDELLDEAEKEEQDRIPMRKRAIKSRLMDFRDYLEARGIAPMSVKSRMSAIQSFYKSNDIQVPALPRSDKKTKPLEQHKAIPSKEDIREILAICDPMERAILLTGLSSNRTLKRARS